MPTALKKRNSSRPKNADHVALHAEPRSLTKREQEVIKLIAEGNKNREIAEELGVSVKTIETHRANIKNKLALRNIADLVHYAIQKGIISVKVD